MRDRALKLGNLESRATTKGVGKLRFALMIEPQQGLSYDEQLEAARRAETAGFEAFFRSDHLQSFLGPAGLPTTDAWAVLAGLARETNRIRLGVLMSPVTFRLPGNFAKVVATVDEMSHGRVELGVGAGWHEEEHRQLGLPFPDIRERAAMLEEQLEILHGLWTQPDGWSFRGHRFIVENAQFYPKPVQHPHPPILVGGDGSPRSMRIAVRYADEFNLTGADPAKAHARFEQLDATARAFGRDPATIVHSVMVGVLVGHNQAKVAQRSRALVASAGTDGPSEAWLAQRPREWIIGAIDDALAQAQAFAEAGCERIVLQDRLPRDLEMIDELGRELVGHV